MPPPRTDFVGVRLLGVLGKGEVEALAAGRENRLGGGERADLDPAPVPQRRDAAVQPRVELDLDAPAAHGHRALGRGEEGGGEQRGRGERRDAPPAQKYNLRPHWIVRIGPASPVIVPPESLSM